MISINIVAVVVSAVVAFVLGFLFHGPLLGKLWMKLANIHPTGNEKLSDMVPQMVGNIVSNIVTAFVLAIMYRFVATSPLSGGPGAWTGVVSALWVWIGFLVTSSSIEVLWMGRSVKLWLFEVGCSLVVMVTMGAIIGSW
ncbi:MAG: DUF1761 domain-containing protein [bacterium]